MTTGPYVPVSFNSEQIQQTKLQQMANNDQWLFENNARVRYNYGGIVRDAGVKIIAGKTPFPATGSRYTSAQVYFGSFFSASCKPIVTTTAEPSTTVNVRLLTVIQGVGMSGEVDYRGFFCHITSHQYVGTPEVIPSSGWLHWIAIGY